MYSAEWAFYDSMSMNSTVLESHYPLKVFQPVPLNLLNLLDERMQRYLEQTLQTLRCTCEDPVHEASRHRSG